MFARHIPELTLLNGMLGTDFGAALGLHQKLGVRLLDLKDSIFGKSFADLNPGEAVAARALIEKHGLEVYTLSSSLGHRDIEEGEAAFRRAMAEEMKKVLEVAAILRPRSVRLLSAWSSRRAEFVDSTAYLDRQHPWVYDVYREGVDRLAEAGYAVFIENEVDRDLFSNAAEIRGFFLRLNCGDRARLTWDIQNLWQMGTFPSLEVYEALRDLIGYLHFKGGRADAEGKLTRASSLEEASWPVAAIVRRAVADGVSPVFCLNPSHGQRRPDDDVDAVTRRDLLFLRTILANL